MKPFVAGIVATYRRPGEIRRLLESLTGPPPEVGALVVVDNGGSPEIRALVERAPFLAHYVNPGRNLGCGGGLKLAGETAWSQYKDQLTHLLVLDDDAVLSPGTVEKLISGIEQAHAGAACAMVVDHRGRIAWLPGLLDHEKERLADGGRTPAEYLEQAGSTPVPFSWAQGICLLASREVIASSGFHRDDFWVRGEDLEFSLRVTAHRPGVWVPGAIVEHLPPSGDAAAARAGEYLKHCAMLQNVAYVALRLSHGRRIAWTIPGNLRRFFLLWGMRALGDAFRALWRGAVLANAAGNGSGVTFRSRFDALMR